MAEQEERDLIFAYPLERYEGIRVPEDSEPALCSRCGVTVLLSPFSQELVTQGFQVVCISCGAPLIDPGQLPNIDPDLWRRVEEFLGIKLSDAKREGLRRWVTDDIDRYRGHGRDV